MNCSHESKDLKPCTSERSVANLKYKFKTKRCGSCQAVLWSKEIDTDFHQWLTKQKKSFRNRFVLQKIQINQDLVSFAEELASSRCTNVSSVYQAALACYFVFAPKHEGWREVLDEAKAESTSPSTLISKLDVNPSMFLEIEANSKLFDMTNSAVASWAIGHVLQVALEAKTAIDQEVRNFVDAALAA
ncbi:MAG: hypothetical protein H7318_17900 [Oligoflexus sp.]|nr:hypothetical protein [Oligoflexus sp.]